MNGHGTTELLCAIQARDYLPHATAAANHADRVTPDWQERAAELFLKYMPVVGHHVLCEEVTRLVHGLGGLPDAPDSRAWGAVVARLARQGKIVRVGYQPAADGSPKSVWRAA